MVVSWIRRLPEREYRVRPGRAQARPLLSVLKVITRREGAAMRLRDSERDAN
jgi:hypothetical protein